MQLLLNYENDYAARITSAHFVEEKGYTGIEAGAAAPA